MRVIVLGAGRVGSLVARELSKQYEVAAADRRKDILEMLHPEVSTVILDVSNSDELINNIKRFDLVVNALPGYLGYSILRACVRAKVNLVDISFMPEDPMPLKDEVDRAGITVVVDAGFAPGLSNILMGRIYHELGPLDHGEINVGGLPKEPKPPLYHMILFSPADLIDEYLRPARMVKEGKITIVDPLSIIERVRILGFYLERFPTDGLRTMLYTIKARNLAEYTLRWPGHLERMRMLKELGFFETNQREKTLKVILPHMIYEGIDMSIMEVSGRVGDSEIRYVLYDEATGGYTSMARVTGYVAVHIVHLVAKNMVPPELVPPEGIGMDTQAFDYILRGIESKGIKLSRIQ